MGNEAASGAGEGGKAAETSTYTPPATQADLDRIVTERIGRERSKYADYDDLKAKADQFDKLEEANKTELQKEKDRADKAEAELGTLRAEKARNELAAEVAKAKGVPAHLLSGTTKEQLEAHADSLKSHFAPEGKKGAVGPYVPNEGTGSGAPKASAAEAFAEAFAEAQK